MLNKSILAMAASAVLLSGCGQPFLKQVSIDSGHGYSLDAKQRLVLVTDKGGISGDQRVVCAEPSPDAVTSFASAVTASGGTPEIGASLGAGFSEAAASIGLRTQTIQLLRDGYYRLCESFMNGAISREQYNIALVNIDRVMGVLLVIDTVAGTPRPPAVAVSPGNPGSSSSVAINASAAGEGEEAAQPGSLDTSANVGATTTKIDIETLSGTSQGLNKEEAGVLMAALNMFEEKRLDKLCMSYLADGGYFDEDEAITVGAKNNLQKKVDFAAFCQDMLTQQVRAALNSAVQNLEQQVIAANATIVEKDKALEASGARIAALNNSYNEARKALADLQSQNVEFSQGLAEKSLDGPKVVLD